MIHNGKLKTFKHHFHLIIYRFPGNIKFSYENHGKKWSRNILGEVHVFIIKNSLIP